MTEEGGLIDPTPIREKIDTAITDLMNLNQRITMILTQRAKDFESIGTMYQSLAIRAFELSDMIANLAVVAAHNTGDIIMAQFGLDTDDDDTEDDEEEDE